MTLRKHRTGALALLAVGAAVAGIAFFRPHAPLALAQEGPEAKTQAAAEAAIRKANADYATALSAADPTAIMALWAADADYVDEAGKQTQGRDNIAALFQKALPDMKGVKVAVKVNSLKFHRPDVCLEDGTVEKTFPTGTKETNRFAIVWTRAGDKWLISSVRDLPAEATDASSVAAARLTELGWLVGEWVDDGAKADVKVTVKWGPKKTSLLMDYVIKQDEADPLEVSVRVGWDARAGRIRSWVFDSEGGFAEAYWRRDGNRWIVGTSGVLPDGGTGGSTNIYEFVDENSFVWRATERDVDGQPLADAEVKFVRPAAKK
ncbi:MAG TPA: SgcJ/EcaC family oxidoreductase [Gemmataceae bacterium]|jgi:uncharacterized protein (TIGR02246 family)|nr:SgcJ/EcaC family oxidoreductase [Gemmataceae bacterium]